MEKESALRFIELLGQKEKIADFIVNQQLAIKGLIQNNETFAEAFRAQKSVELATTTDNKQNAPCCYCKIPSVAYDCNYCVNHNCFLPKEKE